LLRAHLPLRAAVDFPLTKKQNRPTVIRLENVTKEYDAPSGAHSNIVAADRLNLDVPAGEIFGLIGRN